MAQRGSFYQQNPPLLATLLVAGNYRCYSPVFFPIADSEYFQAIESYGVVFRLLSPVNVPSQLLGILCGFIQASLMSCLATALQVIVMSKDSLQLSQKSIVVCF